MLEENSHEDNAPAPVAIGHRRVATGGIRG